MLNLQINPVDQCSGWQVKPSPEESAELVRQIIESLTRANKEYPTPKLGNTKIPLGVIQNGTKLLQEQTRTHLAMYLPGKYSRLKKEGTLDQYLNSRVKQAESLYELGKDLPPSGLDELVREILFEPAENDS
jgi:hypothetical protein